MMRWNDLLVLIDVVGRLASREESDWLEIPERKKNAITKTSEWSALQGEGEGEGEFNEEI